MNYIELLERLRLLDAYAPEHEAAEFIRVISGKSREWCVLNRTAELPNGGKLESALKKRSEGIPLQYILGEAWFYGRQFNVSQDCLIPQPDTEHTVGLALKCLPKSGTLLDLCTGSGCIAISVLAERPDIHATAVDISEPALAIARSNSKLHEVSEQLTLIEADVLANDISSLIADADVITANPPYIKTEVISTLSAEVQHEPHIALDGGVDGLDFYRHFICTLSKHMKNDTVMILEIGYDQHEKIKELCEGANLCCNFHRDFGNNIRVTEIRRNKAENN